MKYTYLALVTTALSCPAIAQTPGAPSTSVEQNVNEKLPAAPVRITPEVARRLDAALARERLGIAPVVLPARKPTVVETTTTTVETPGLPTRVYNTKRNVVVVDGRELPYLTVPVLFIEGTADLLDGESRLAIEDTANAIKSVLATDPTAIFDVEGHTSTDGTEELNLKLSADRSRRIYRELTESYNVPASALAAHGYGENFPNFPGGTEEQMVLDRRVLVVRVR